MGGWEDGWVWAFGRVGGWGFWWVFRACFFFQKLILGNVTFMTRLVFMKRT